MLVSNIYERKFSAHNYHSSAVTPGITTVCAPNLFHLVLTERAGFVIASHMTARGRAHVDLYYVRVAPFSICPRPWCVLCGCGMENGEEWPVKLSTGKRSKAYAWAHSVMLHRVDPLSFGLLTCCCLLHHLHYTQFSSSSSSLFVVRLRIGFGRRGRVRASRYFNFLFSAAVIVSSPPTTHRSHTWTLWRTEVASVLVLSMSYCLTAFCFYALSLRGCFHS